MNNTACQQGQTRVKVYLSGAAQAATTYFCASLSEGPESNYRIQSGNGKYMSHAQPHRLRFEICNQPEFPIRSRQGFCCASGTRYVGTRADLELSLHLLLCCNVCYLFCYVLIYWTNISTERYWCSSIVLLEVTGTNVGPVVGFWKQIKLHLRFYLLKSLLSDMTATDGLHSK